MLFTVTALLQPAIKIASFISIACFGILSLNQVANASQTQDFSKPVISLDTNLVSSAVEKSTGFSHRNASTAKTTRAWPRIPIEFYLLVGNRLGTADDSFDKNPVNINLGIVSFAAEVGSIIELGAAVAIFPFQNSRFQLQSTYMSRSFVTAPTDNDNNSLARGDMTKSGIDLTAYFGIGEVTMYGLGYSKHFNIKFRTDHLFSAVTQDFSGDDANGWHIAALFANNGRIKSNFVIRFTAIDYFVPYLDRTIDESTLDIQWLYALH